MRGPNRHLLGLAVCVAWLALSQLGRACVIRLPKKNVGSDFVVNVRDLQGKPVIGAEVDIYGVEPKSTQFSRVTDKLGRAEFKGLKEGQYVMSAERNDVEAEIVDLRVGSSGPANVDLKWPGRLVSKLANVEGTLVRAAHPGVPGRDKEVILPDIKLVLFDAYSGREVGRVSTDEEGKFAFPQVPAGLYALRVYWNDGKPKWGGDYGYILLSVSSSGEEGEPSRFSVELTDCGVGIGLTRDNAKAN